MGASNGHALQKPRFAVFSPCPVACRFATLRVLNGGRAVRGPTGGEEPYLVRVVVDLFEDEELIVTAYRTSRIEKYWEHR